MFGSKFVVMCLLTVLIALILAVSSALFPLYVPKSDKLSFDPSNLSVLLNSAEIIYIKDSDECIDNEEYGGCLISDCKKSLANTSIKKYCEYTLALSRYTKFEKVSISCLSKECSVVIDSVNFSASHLYVYGDRLSMQAGKLQADQMFFDTNIGSLHV